MTAYITISAAAVLVTLALPVSSVMFCPPAHAEGVSPQTMRQIVAHIPLEARWQLIEVSDEAQNSNRVTLWYKATAYSPSEAEVEKDTERRGNRSTLFADRGQKPQGP